MWSVKTLLLKEIQSLRATVSSLSKEISALKSTSLEGSVALSDFKDLKEKVSTLSQDVSLLKVPGSDTTDSSTIPQYHDVPGQSSDSFNPPNTSAHQAKSSRKSSSYDINERKYNIMLFGITEKPNGTPRSERFNSDYDEVSHVLHRLDDDSDHVCLVRDCKRIGRFSSLSNRPCPLLVTLGSTSDVSYILSKRRSLSSPLFIRRHVSPTQCLEWSILLREKRKLMESGTVDATTVKIRKSHLYVGDRLVGMVADGVFISSQGTGALAPSPSECGPVLSPQTGLHVSQTDRLYLIMYHNLLPTLLLKLKLPLPFLRLRLQPLESN